MVAGFLSGLPLFSKLGPVDLARVAASTTVLRVARGKLVFRRGDPCAGFHAVVVGRVKLALASSQGIEKILAIVEAGHSFGEGLIFLDRPHIVNAQALGDSVLLHVPSDVVFNALDAEPRFARRMLLSMSQQLQGLLQDMASNSFDSGTQRVVSFLLRNHRDNDGNRFALPASKTVVASRLSLTPEHFSRILHDLVNHQLIDVSGRIIAVVDAAALAAYSHEHH